MGDTDQLISNMWARIHQARRLAKSTTDREVTDLLLRMAADGEADVRRLEAERDAAQLPISRRPE